MIMGRSMGQNMIDIYTTPALFIISPICVFHEEKCCFLARCPRVPKANQQRACSHRFLCKYSHVRL